MESVFAIVRGQDFVDPTPFEVTFTEGTSIPSSSKISVTTVADKRWEGPQSFLVSISGTTHGVVIGMPNNQIIEIADNDC